MIQRSPARLLRFGAIAALFVAISGCYLPLRFDAEIEMHRTGHYNAVFDGYVADIGIYDGIKRKGLKGKELREKIERVERDLRRSSDFKEAKHLREGVFKVHWQHEGDIISEKMHTFIRRNEQFLTLKYLKQEGRIIISGRKLKNTQVEQLAKIGLGTTDGKLRVLTSAKVVEHNATKVTRKKGGGHIYHWTITSFKNPAPKLVITLY